MKMFSTKNYQYQDTHTAYLLIQFNPDFNRPHYNELNEPVFGRFEIKCCSLSYEYINSVRGGNGNQFVMSVPGPEKVYNVLGVERQVEYRDSFIYVSINSINGDIITDWKPEYWAALKDGVGSDNHQNWIHYKLPLDITISEEYSKGKISGPMKNNPFIYCDDEEENSDEELG